MVAANVQVTIVPREKFPLGQTVVKVNEQRERTNLFTRRYLEEQLLTVLAGTALLLVRKSCVYRIQDSGPFHVLSIKFAVRTLRAAAQVARRSNCFMARTR